MNCLEAVFDRHSKIEHGGRRPPLNKFDPLMKGMKQMFSPINRIAPVCLAGAICLIFVHGINAQKNRSALQTKKPVPAATATPRPETAKTEKYAPGTVVDERLSVLRVEPSLYSIPLQRIRRGRTVMIYSSREADGVLFYSVMVPPDKRGWVQAEAVATTIRRGDDERLIRLIQASEGFEQVERASIFLETFPGSPLRPAILLYQGDLIEDMAQKLTIDANKRLDKDEMKATGAPAFSFFLNYAGLDRYRRLGIVFLFNDNTKYFHYDGECWKELVTRFPDTNEAVEAKKRLESLKQKMAQAK
jgi:hypothetical protein